MAGRYSFLQDSEGLFSLFEDGVFLASFTRQTFRDVLSQLGRSSNWIGSILRLFLNKYPPTPVICHRTDLQRAVDGLGENGLAQYLRSKGFRVTKSIKIVSDEQIIEYLESNGYIIQGLLGSYYYETKVKDEHIEKPKITYRD